MIDLETFLKHYLLAALWSSADNDGTSLTEEYCMDDFSTESIEKATKDCIDFIALVNNLLTELLTEAFELETGDYYQYQQQHGLVEMAGHDFWLTRAWHGTGFWDRNLGKIGEKLTKITKDNFRYLELYVGDDNKLYFM